MGRLINIVNWGLYQGVGEAGNKVTNKEVTTNNNDNNDK